VPTLPPHLYPIEAATGGEIAEFRRFALGLCDNHNVTLDLEYPPWLTATSALRASVADAFAQAGLPHPRDTTAPGGDGPLPPGSRVGTDEPVGRPRDRGRHR
jgi:hypothetical protein